MPSHLIILSIALINLVYVSRGLDENIRASRIIKIDQGQVRGYKLPKFDVFGFFGIPYATVPKGVHRFKGPLPPRKWAGTFEATEQDVGCRQWVDPGNPPLATNVKEECLIVNIYVPDTEEKNLPVIVFSHGGAFQIGNGEMLTPSRIVHTKRIIAVSFNYRLGAIGFLCLGTDMIPGNAGMKDHVAVLKWVQKNIASFGGNPNDVTIHGYSAGSTAVELLMLSKTTRGLFHKVIADSVSAIAAVSIQMDPLANAKEYARLLNFTDVDDIKALEEFYLDASMELLTSVDLVHRLDSSPLLLTCVEREEVQDAFLTSTPIDIIREGAYPELPMLYGFTNMEGHYRLTVFEEFKDMMNEDFNQFLPVDLQFSDEKEKQLVARRIKEFYFGNQPVGPKTILKYVEYFGDVMFTYPMLRALKFYTENGHKQIYLYEFSFAAETRVAVPYVNVRGAIHCAQTDAIMDIGDEEMLSKEYQAVKRITRELWLNFITKGKPSLNNSSDLTWPPVGANRSPHMSLDVVTQLRGAAVPDRATFWDAIYEKYYIAPIPPPLYTESVVLAQNESKTVMIEQGFVKGYKLEKHDVFAFHGIPFATAPTGSDRFKAPLSPPKWNGVLEAVEENIVCPQYQTNSMQSDKTLKVREDCLITSIYVPNTNKTNLPVIVYVHGGAYQGGYADNNTPKTLVNSKDIIFAAFNYRVGAHGFLCLGTDKIPGNAGMKDQVTFLRWVKKNIASFGGNPNDVTIYGNSAGSRSVDLLMLSKSTAGLFKSVIGDSGGSLGPETVQIDPLANAKVFARLLNFDDVDNIKALEDFYLNASYEELNSIDTTKLQSYLFTPCVERDLGDEVVLGETPYDILKSGEYLRVPLLISFTEMDGTFRMPMFNKWRDGMNKNITNFLPLDLEFPTFEERDIISKRVKDYYFGDHEINEENILLFINYFTDTIYVFPILRALKLHLQAGHDQIYLYEYSFTSEESPRVQFINKPGAFHSWQTNNILDRNTQSSDSVQISPELLEMKRIMKDIYSTFVITGKPTESTESSLPQWLPVHIDNIYLLSLNNTIEIKPLNHRSLFWEEIYDKYYKQPIPPRDWTSSL
ncbi:unnamed protein product [Leptosia nina]|uniref:Carboxylesterase type B domain-containing protein n=1 Tax=Leptosia nina TaxID=320188 RepID=A0AAV1IYD7_9NEOP